MSNRHLQIICADERRADAEELATALAESWAVDACPDRRIVPLSAWPDAAPGSEDCGIVLLPAESGIDHTGLRALDLAHDACIPTLIIGDRESCARSQSLDVVHLANGTDHATIAAVLVGMLGRQPEVDRYRMQVDTSARLVNKVHEEIEKLDEELQAAAMVQRDFLPGSLPRLGTVSVGALWRPTSYVSGDYYDVRKIDEDRLGVFIADAAGHGVPSALMTMLIARAFEFAWTRHGDDPAAVMTSLNHEFCLQQTGITRFATSVYAVIDCRTGVVRYSSAGHPPPLVLAAGELRALANEDGGGLLGVFPDETFSVMVEKLAPGETFLLHSDGFEQAFPMPNATLDEMARPTTAYLDAFRSLGELDDPVAMTERISKLVDERRGSLNPCDDLTLLCVHREQVRRTLLNAG